MILRVFFFCTIRTIFCPFLEFSVYHYVNFIFNQCNFFQFLGFSVSRNFNFLLYFLSYSFLFNLYTKYYRSSTIISPDILFTSFNSQPLNKNHAANLIAEFLLTRPSRDVTAIFSALSLHSTMSLLNLCRRLIPAR